MTIRILPKSVSDRIRAGEVLERPAQALKEMIENSLDAGVRRLTMHVRGGGASIVVTDDGCGMDVSDLRMCVLRHATSKMPGDDPMGVDTLGFRGEALAAIAAVSILTVTTRTADASHAWSMKVDNGEASAPTPGPGLAGTTMRMDGLFARVPARAAILRKPKTEYAVMRSIVEAHALARPDVEFVFSVENGAVRRYNASDARGRMEDVMGRSFAEAAVPFSKEAEGVSVTGWVAAPTWDAPAGTGQRVIVGGRPVSDAVVASALRSAMVGISKETAPAAVVHLSVRGYDFNVSPSKSEVRFPDPALVHETIRSAVAEALGAASPIAVEQVTRLAMSLARPLATTDGGRKPHPSTRPMGEALGDLGGGRYLVSRTSDSLIISDAHAISERCTYEALRRAAATGGMEETRLPTPVDVRIGHEGEAALDGASERLGELGLRLVCLGDGVVTVFAVPGRPTGTDVPTLIRKLAAILTIHPHSDALGETLDEVCATLACHISHRSGDPLTIDQMDGMLRDFEGGGDSTCMHGRSVSFRLAGADLDRLFGR